MNKTGYVAAGRCDDARVGSSAGELVDSDRTWLHDFRGKLTVHPEDAEAIFYVVEMPSILTHFRAGLLEW